MFHRSERLFLRPAFAEDWRAVLAGVGRCEVVRNLARAPWPYGEREAREFVARPQDVRYPNFLVALPEAEGAPVIGSAGLAPRDGETELGYWIACNHWGRGYATEAARAVIQVARTLGHRRLVAGHFLDNPASGRVLRKLGFASTGVVTERWSEGRGEAADCAEYALELDGGEGRRLAA